MLGFRPTWRSLFIGVKRFEASEEENVPYGKINVRPRLLSDVKSNLKQTQRSNMGSIPGKHRPERSGVNFKEQRLTPVAGLIFETKNREIFLERFFWREITAREQVSRAVILEKI